MSSPSPAPGEFDRSSPVTHALNLQYAAAAAAVAAATAAHQQRSDALALAVLHIDRAHLLLRKLQQASTQLIAQTLQSNQAPSDHPLLTASTARRLLTLEEAQLGAHRTLLRLHSPTSPTANPAEGHHAYASVLRSLVVLIMLRNWMASRAFAEGELQATEHQLMKAQAVMDSAPNEDLAAAAVTGTAGPCASALQSFQRAQAHTWCNLACVLRFVDPVRGVQWAKRALQLIRTTRGLHARTRAECAADAAVFHGGAYSAASSSHFSLLFDLITPPPSLFDAYPIALLCTVDCLGELRDSRRAAKLAGKACAFLKADFESVRNHVQRRRKKREQVAQPHRQQQQDDDDAETASILREKALVIASAYSTLATHQSSLGQLDHAFVNYSSAHAIAAHFLGATHDETRIHEDNLRALETEWLSEMEAQEDARERHTMQQQQQQQQQPPRMMYLRQHLTPRSESPVQAMASLAWRPPPQPHHDRRSASEYSDSTLDHDDDNDHDFDEYDDRRRSPEAAADEEEWLSNVEGHDEFDQHSYHVESNDESSSSRSCTPSPTAQRAPSLPIAAQNGVAAAATTTQSPREVQLARLASLTRGQSVQAPVDRPLCIEAAFEPSPHSIVAPVTPSAAARIAHTRGTSLELRRALSATPSSIAAESAHPPPPAVAHQRQPSVTGLRQQASTSLAPSSSRSQLHRRQDSIARPPSASSAAATAPNATNGSTPNSSRGRPAPLHLPSGFTGDAAPVLPFLLRSPSAEDRPAEPLWLGRPRTPRTPAADPSSLSIPSSTFNGSALPSSSPCLQNGASLTSASAVSPRPRSPRPSSFLDVGPRPSSQRTPSMVLAESIMHSVKVAEGVRKRAMEDAEAKAQRGGVTAATGLDSAAEYALELSIKKAQHDAIAATLAPEDAGRVDLICLMQEQTAAEMQHELAKSAYASSAEEQLRRKLLMGKQRKPNRRAPSMAEREFFAAAGSPKLGSPKGRHVGRPSFGGCGGGHARNPSLARLLSRTGSIPSAPANSSTRTSAPTSPTSADVMDATLSAVLIAEAVRNEVLAAHAAGHAHTSPADLEARIHEAQAQAIVDSLAPDERDRASFLLMFAESAQHDAAVKQHAASQASAQESEWKQKLARGKGRRDRT